MADLVTLITQNGIGVVCVAFMIYFIATTMKENNRVLDEIQKTLVAIQTNLVGLSTRIDKIEEQVKVKVKVKKKEEK